MDKKILFLNDLGVDEVTAKIIIDYFMPDTLDNYVAVNFRASNALIKNKWIPSKVLYDFINMKRPHDVSTANLIGRSLKKIGVYARNNHLRETGSISGYYVEAIDNVLHLELKKFYRDYGF
jgi:hypothetical protein